MLLERQRRARQAFASAEDARRTNCFRTGNGLVFGSRSSSFGFLAHDLMRMISRQGESRVSLWTTPSLKVNEEHKLLELVSDEEAESNHETQSNPEVKNEATNDVVESDNSREIQALHVSPEKPESHIFQDSYAPPLRTHELRTEIAVLGNAMLTNAEKSVASLKKLLVLCKNEDSQVFHIQSTFCSDLTDRFKNWQWFLVRVSSKISFLDTKFKQKRFSTTISLKRRWIPTTFPDPIDMDLSRLTKRR